MNRKVYTSSTSASGGESRGTKLLAQTNPAFAQFAAAEVSLVVVDVVAVAGGYRASKLRGATVVNPENEKIGELDDLIVGKDRVLFGIIQVGGFLGLGSHFIAVPYSSLQISDVTQIDVPGVCPTCGTLPVSSIVRADKRSQGYRYLHCPLCATEWHMVRITCSQCLANDSIVYHSIEGGSAAVRAESCGKCHTYRKILYQEKFRVTLNTDNRLMSDTTMTTEFEAARDAFGLAAEDFEKLTINAMKSAFLPYNRRYDFIYSVIKPGYATIRSSLQ